MSAANPLVSIVIVTYNSAQILPRCLAALAQTTYTPFEIVVVDNASTDNTRDLVDDRRPTTDDRKRGNRQPTTDNRQLTTDDGQRTTDNGQQIRVRLIQSPNNLGFGRACNLGAKVAQGELLVFFNPDVVVVPQWLERLVACACAYPGALLSPQTLYPNESPRSVPQWVTEEASLPGGALLVPRSVWQQLGGFDSHFFLYWEDTELCWRAWLLGFRVLADHRSYVFHQRGGSAGNRRWDAERTKNSLRTYLKLMRWRVVFLFIVVLVLKTAAKLVVYRDLALLGAWQWNWRNLGLTLAERREMFARQKGDPAHLECLIRLHDHRMQNERARRTENNETSRLKD